MRQSRGILIIIAFFVLVYNSAAPASGLSYSVLVRTDRDAYVAGEYVEISGFVTDRGNVSVSTFVEIAVFTPENASLLTDATHSNSEGYFFTILSLPSNASLGVYLVVAAAEGSAAYSTFRVALNSITCGVNASIVHVPDAPVLVYGDAYPARRVEVRLEFSQNDGDWRAIASIYANSSGHYGYDWTAPGDNGNYSIRASLEGVASSPAHLRVFLKESTVIWLSLTSPSVYVGKAIQVEGALSSTSRNATITIQYRSSQGTSLNHTVRASPEGAFSDTYKPDVEGIWTISASWPGDALNLPAISMGVQLTVGPPPPTMLFLSVVAVEDAAVLALLAWQISKKRKASRH